MLHVVPVSVNRWRWQPTALRRGPHDLLLPAARVLREPMGSAHPLPGNRLPGGHSGRNPGRMALVAPRLNQTDAETAQISVT